MTVQAPPLTRSMTLTAMDDIIRTVDEHARQINHRWGFNRLPHLVPLEWTERFRSQKRKWELACFECVGSLKPDDLERVRKHGTAMLRAFDALERAAVDAGHSPSPATWWEFELADGTPVLLVRDRAELSQVDTGGRAAQIWSLEEVASIIARFPEFIRVKDSFPGAEVIQMSTSRPVRDALDDELTCFPFEA